MTDPPRLRELTDGDAFTRELLRGAAPTSAFSPTDAARLQVKVASVAAKSTAGWFAMGAVTKGVAVVALVAGGALAVESAHRAPRASAQAAARVHVAPSRSAHVVPVATGETASTRDPVAPIVERAPAPDPARAPAPASPRVHHAATATTAPVAAPVAPTLAEELSLDSAAHAALQSDPARAVELLTSARRAMHGGQMRDERDAQLVEALVRSGRRAEALALAGELEQRAPQSPQSARVRELLREAP